MHDNYLLYHSNNAETSYNLSQVSDEMNFDGTEEAHILTFQSKYSKYRKGYKD